jgi:hypothetical protein
LDSASRVRRVLTTDTHGNRIDQQVVSLVIDAPLSVDVFTNAIPKRVSPPPPHPASAVGTPFPNWTRTVPMVDGSSGSLQTLLAGKKGALIWFWNTTCLSCMQEFPYFEQMYRTLRARGITAVALDIVHEDTIQAKVYRDFHGTTMPVMLDSVMTEPLAKGMGPFIVVDSSGTVVEEMSEPDFPRLYNVLVALTGGRPIKD